MTKCLEIHSLAAFLAMCIRGLTAVDTLQKIMCSATLGLQGVVFTVESAALSGCMPAGTFIQTTQAHYTVGYLHVVQLCDVAACG